MPNFSDINRTPGTHRAPDVSPALLRLPEVKRITGLSTTEIYKRIAADTFPRQVKVGPMTACWIESEIRGWIAARIAERDATSPRIA